MLSDWKRHSPKWLHGNSHMLHSNHLNILGQQDVLLFPQKLGVLLGGNNSIGHDHQWGIVLGSFNPKPLDERQNQRSLS